MRGPNTQTRRSGYPLPVIRDLLVKHGTGAMFSIYDLRQAFHQQPMHPDSRPITATYTPDGIYQWTVNVMGLTNAPQQFQAMIDWCLRPVADCCSLYIDDIIIGTDAKPGETREQLLQRHYLDVRRVLQTLKEQRLIADLRKCKFFVPEVEFCGHIMGNGERRPAPGKLMAVEKFEPPKTITGLRSFLGLTNYYAEDIQNYSKLFLPCSKNSRYRARTVRRGVRWQLYGIRRHWTRSRKSNASW